MKHYYIVLSKVSRKPYKTKQQNDYNGSKRQVRFVFDLISLHFCASPQVVLTMFLASAISEKFGDFLKAIDIRKLQCVANLLPKTVTYPSSSINAVVLRSAVVFMAINAYPFDTLIIWS